MSELEPPAEEDKVLPPAAPAAQEPARPAPPASSSAPALPFAFTDRALVVGTTGCGKSVLAEMLVSDLRCRVLVIDPKGEAKAYGARRDARGVRAWLEEKPTPQTIATFPRVIRWVPASGTPEEYEEVYEAAHRFRGPLVVLTDELYGPGTAQTAPRHLRLYLTQGRGLRHGHIGLTQRPANVCMEARTEWNHLVIYAPPPDPGDLRAIAASTGLDTGELARILERVPEHGFVWVDRRTREVTVSGPVPLEVGRII